MSVREFRAAIDIDNAVRSYVKSERLALVETMIDVYVSRDMKWHLRVFSLLVNISIACFIVAIAMVHVLPFFFGMVSLLGLLFTIFNFDDEYRRASNRYYRMPMDAFVCSCAYKSEDRKKN